MNSVNFKSSKFFKNFEIGKSQMASVTGGTEVLYETPYTLPNNDACSASCPDSTRDHRDGGVAK